MKCQACTDLVDEKMLPILNNVRGKYNQAITGGTGATRMDELFRSFGMNAEEIKFARNLVDSVLLHSAIIGSDKCR